MNVSYSMIICMYVQMFCMLHVKTIDIENSTLLYKCLTELHVFNSFSCLRIGVEFLGVFVFVGDIIVFIVDIWINIIW